MYDFEGQSLQNFAGGKTRIIVLEGGKLSLGLII
jgi:hypothetical protein